MSDKLNVGGLIQQIPADTTLKIQPGKSIRRIEIGNLVKENDPILREPCEYWDFSEDAKLHMPMSSLDMARLLIDTAKAYGALGLAAPQIGYPYRVFCIGSGDQWQICFNPSYNARLERKKGNEGCLSFPGLSIPVERAVTIDTSFYMPDGSLKQEVYEGMTARAFQHEYDHLNGVLFTDHIGEMRLIMAREKRKKLIRKIERRNKQKR